MDIQTTVAVVDRDFSPIGRAHPSRASGPRWRVHPHPAFRERFPDLDAETYPLNADEIAATFDHLLRVDRPAEDLAERWRE